MAHIRQVEVLPPQCCHTPTRSCGRRWQSIGFVAAFTQMIGASLFQLSVVAGVPNLISPNDWQLVDALVWTPQAR